MAQRLISACLLGQACRYDGASKPAAAVIAQVAAWRAVGDEVVVVCPEELGALGTPRPAAELRGGDGHAALSGRATVAREGDGVDVTAAFVAGAYAAAKLAPRAISAVLKANSPSCGCSQTTIDGRRQVGDGVFAALLRQRGVAVQTDEDLADAR
jgi:uncharacterized protein YbbK (DUF523 family)